jgi:hypothetical protein
MSDMRKDVIMREIGRKKTVNDCCLGKGRRIVFGFVCSTTSTAPVMIPCTISLTMVLLLRR